MSRFPLFPLLLSLSTTLQSACLQDKCSVQPFKDNDAECMPDMTISPDLSVLPDGNNNPNMTKLASFGTTLSYQFTLTGSKKRVDSVGMIELKKNDTDGNIEIGQVGALIADHVNHKIGVILQTIKIKNGVPVSLPKMNVPEADSTIPVTDQIDSASFSRAGVTYFAKDDAGKSAMFFAPWFSVTGPIGISEKDTGQYYSLSSDVDGRIHAVINSNGTSASLLVSRSSVFYSDNLFKWPDGFPAPRRVLVGNLDRDQEPELITWDSMGSNAMLFKYDGNAFVEKSRNVPSLGICAGIICPVALGDLNQDGLSDLVIANNPGIKIHYAKVVDGKTSFTEATNYPAALNQATNVEAIAVSIPSGDDKPKLVWATSSFTPDKIDSPTGTNTITINVLPIMN